MGMRAADEMGMGHAHQLDVVDVAPLACDETPVFLAHYTCANTFNTHRISPCRTASSAPKSWSAQFAPGFEFRRQKYVADGGLFRRHRNLHAAGGVQHRFDDVVVAGTAADIALQLVPDGILVELATVAVDDIDRRHDHARRAIAALQAAIVA